MIVDAKFVYTGGHYAEFRGYVFANGNPAHIKDGATLEALLKRPDFKRIDNEEIQRKETAEEVLRPVLTAKRGWPLGRPRK